MAFNFKKNFKKFGFRTPSTFRIAKIMKQATNKNYVKSIKKARKEYQNKDIFTHEEVFGED